MKADLISNRAFFNKNEIELIRNSIINHPTESLSEIARRLSTVLARSEKSIIQKAFRLTRKEKIRTRLKKWTSAEDNALIAIYQTTPYGLISSKLEEMAKTGDRSVRSLWVRLKTLRKVHNISKKSSFLHSVSERKQRRQISDLFYTKEEVEMMRKQLIDFPQKSFRDIANELQPTIGRTSNAICNKLKMMNSIERLRNAKSTSWDEKYTNELIARYSSISFGALKFMVDDFSKLTGKSHSSIMTKIKSLANEGKLVRIINRREPEEKKSSQIIASKHNVKISGDTKKQTYTDAEKKKRVRDFLIDKFYFNHVIGLPGPDINDYIRYMRSKGCENLELYENDKNVMLKQLIMLSENEDNIRFIYGDIINASPAESHTLYDLDFCATVKFLKRHIQKFRNSFIMTFSLRIGVENTIKEFFAARGDRIISRSKFQHPIEYEEISTGSGKYLFVRYCDTSAMCCFAKIS
jgi:hypothetical protein